MILCSRGVVVALCLAGVGAGVVYAQSVPAACTTCSVYEALPSFLLRVHGAQPLFGPTPSTRITGRIGTYQPSYSDVGATYRAYNGYADAGLRVSFREYLFAELSTTGAGSVAHVSSPLGGGWIEGLGAGIALGGGVGDKVTYLRAYASFTSVIVNLASDNRRLKDHLATYGAAWGLEGGTRLPLWWITLSPRVGVYGANVDFESFTDAVGARVSLRSVTRNSWSVGVVAESPMWKPYTMYTSVDVRQIFEGTATAVDVSGEILESAVVPTPAVDLGVGGLYHISNLSIGGSMKVDGIETGDLGFSAKMDLVVRW